MRSMLMALATAVSMALLASGVAVADTVPTDFEAFTPGSVNAQGGWKSGPLLGAPNGRFDEEVMSSGGTTGFGNQSLRLSNKYATGAFDNQTYSGPVASPAGEMQPNTEFIAEFSFYFQDARQGAARTLLERQS